MDTDKDSYFNVIPRELAEKILHFLSDFDLLTLRSVCQTTKFWIENFTTAEDWVDYELKIDGSESRNFGAAVDLHLPITKFYINNSDTQIYNDPCIQEFLESYGSGIKKLKVHHFETFLSDAEFNFIAALPNLEELELEYIDASERIDRTPRRGPLPRFPENFRRLKVLKPGKIKAHGRKGTRYHRQLMSACPQLESMQYPYVLDRHPSNGRSHDNNLFEDIQEYIQRQIDQANGALMLKVVDMKPLLDYDKENHELNYTISAFMDFIEHLATKKRNVKLDNVPVAYLETIIYRDEINVPDSWARFDCIRSLHGVIPAVRLLPLKGMEEITIPKLSEAHLISNWDLDFYPRWKNLTSIKVNFDQDVPDYLSDANEVLNFILYNDNDFRNSVKKLDFSFEESHAEVAKLLRPRTLCEKMPHLEILKLYNWNPVNRSFVQLWNNLPDLKELYVASCGTLGNVGFIGEDITKPVFLKLTNLRKLTLKLDGMPKVTDTFFKDVLSKMKLKELVLISEAPLTTITADGIRALAEGDFRSSIRKFRFNSWSLANTSDEEFRSLKKLFPGN